MGQLGPVPLWQGRVGLVGWVEQQASEASLEGSCGASSPRQGRGGPGSDRGFLGRVYRGLLEDGDLGSSARAQAYVPAEKPPASPWPQSPTCWADLLALTQAGVLKGEGRCRE